MAEFFLPCLLDRLVDRQPRVKVESRDDRRMSFDLYKATVIRDLVHLLNATPLPDELRRGASMEADLDDPPGVPLANFPEVESSVLNYGVPLQVGGAGEGDAGRELAHLVRLAIERFEPRVSEVEVRLITEDDLKTNEEKDVLRKHFQMGFLPFEIEAKLYAEPTPEHLFIKTELDLKDGRWLL
jgi:type VI secretion system protein ImpF